MFDKSEPRIMVVDQDLGMLTSMDSLLTRQGYLVTICSSSAEALSAVARNGLDVVIAGATDSEWDGTALVSRIKGLSPGMKVVLVLNGNCSKGYIEKMARSADALLVKPYSESQVLDKVERLLGIGGMAGDVSAKYTPRHARHGFLPSAAPGAAPVGVMNARPAARARHVATPRKTSALMYVLGAVALALLAYVVAGLFFPVPSPIPTGRTPLGQLERSGDAANATAK